MRSAGILALLLYPAMSFAAPLPLSGTYGNTDTCALYATGGSHAVFSFGNSLDPAMSVDESAPDFVLVSASEVLGAEWACEPSNTSGAEIAMSCTAPGEKFELTATIEENGDAITYADPDRRVTLHRCD